MLKNISRYSWFSFVPCMILLPCILYALFVGIIPAIYLLLTLVGWTLISGLGIAVGYHRIFSHKTHSLPTWKENIILFLGALGGQGSALAWVAIHRGYHHPHSDRERDLHSPVVHGIWHAFFGWTLKITEANSPFSLKYAVDLARRKNQLWFHKHIMKIQWLTPLFIGLLFGWQIGVMLVLLPTCISILQDNLVNVFGHIKAGIGYRNFETNDQSQNNFILGYLGWGQGWHNNHHADPASFDFGKKWWEFDPCRIFLPFL